MKTVINWIIGITIIWFVFSAIGNFGNYEGQTAEEWFNEYDASETRAEDLKNALDQANTNIDNAKY